MTKILYPVLEGLEWIARHKWPAIIFQYVCYITIFLLCGVYWYQWQYWVIAFVLIVFVTWSYIHGRVDKGYSKEELEKLVEKKVDEIWERETIDPHVN